MATTTKSSKAKTKTSKAKVSKSSTSKVAKKTTAKKVAKLAEKQPTAKTVSKAQTSATMLQKIYAVSIAFYVAIAGAAYFLMNKTSYQLSVGYWGKDSLASSSTTVFAPATQGVFDIQVRYIVMGLAVLSIIVPALYLTRLKAYHADGLKKKVMPTRWIDMAVAVAIMVETVAILSGVLDIATLKLVGGLMAVTCVLGWMAEKRTAEAGKPATAKYYLSMVTGLLPWVLIAFYSIATYIYGEIRMQWFVYALYVVLLVGVGVIGKFQLRALRAEGEFKNYELVERNYSILTLSTRVLFSVVLIIGLMAK